MKAVRKKSSREYGGAALEYIIVCTFAAVATMAALGFIGKVIKEQLSNLGSKLGLESEVDVINPFDDSNH